MSGPRAAPELTRPLPSDDAALLERACPGGTPRGATGLFADDSWVRRISGSPVALLGGGRALLLEIAHPFVAAGVAEHSDFRADPFGRLRRTLAAMSAITFGDVPAALAAARAIEGAHGRVVGELPSAAGEWPAGTPYHGRDVESVRWVWATLADSARVVYERFVEPLDAAARDAYHAEHAVIGRLLGVPAERVPDDARSFRSYFDEMLTGGRLAVTPLAREIAEAVLHPKPETPATRLGRAVTAGLMPERLREAFGLPWDAAREAKLDAMVASVRALRAEGRSVAGGGGI